MEEHNDFLPVYEFVPSLSAEEVQRYVTLGEQGWKLHRSGDVTGAEAAFRSQIAIFGANPEPFVSLALLEGARGSNKAALEHLRAAVVRGFTELWRIENAEAWTLVRGTSNYRRLVDVVPALIDIEKKWPGWDAFFVRRAPENLTAVLDNRADAVQRIDAMAPALGPRLTTLWKRLFDRAAATQLEVYVAEKAGAEDIGEALDHLMALYSSGPLLRWQRLPAAAADRLATVSNRMLDGAPESSARPTALVAQALANNMQRDRKGALRPHAAQTIRAGLAEVLTEYPDSVLSAIAAIGLIRTEMETGREEQASQRYRRFCEDRSDDLPLINRVREDLGVMALQLGGLPTFQATTLDGETIGAAELEGKVVVIDFWATWCRPCVDEFPTLRRIHERYGDDIVMLGVNLDSADDLDAEDLRAWVASQGLPGTQLHDGMSWDSELVKIFGVREIPFSVVVAPDGAVVAVNAHGKKLKQAVTTAVRSKSEPDQRN